MKRMLRMMGYGIFSPGIDPGIERNVSPFESAGENHLANL